MRLARTEEAGNPDAVGGQFGEVAVGEDSKAARHITRNHIFLQLRLQVACIIGLDDAVNWAFNRFEEKFVDFHAGQRR